MKHWAYIEKYADDSEFSHKLWQWIPHWVYIHSELTVSSESESDENLSQSEDNDEAYDPHNEAEVDPYIRDNAEK